MVSMNLIKQIISLPSFMFLIFITGDVLGGTSYYDDRQRGWYWHEVLEEPPEELEIEPIEPAQSVEVKLTATEIIKKQRESFDEALSLAIINPTSENVRNYLAISKLINEQAGRFSNKFKESIWVNPEFDYSITGRPTNTQALVAHNQANIEEQYRDLATISSEKGIVYFFRSDCPYCKRFSPILKKFAKQFGFTIIPVSLDNKGSPDFPYPKNSQYMANKFNVSVVPATYLIDPDKNKVVTVGYGFSDWSSLIEKILVANNKMTPQQFTNK